MSVLAIGSQFTGDYPAIGAACAFIYAIGMLVVIWAPNTAGKSL